MRNIIVFAVLCGVLSLAIVVGSLTDAPPRSSTEQKGASRIPHIGRIQVLNGCGITGAASAVSDYLRDRGFDVKNIGNADTWNYPFTLVVSRTKDGTIARQISDALGTDKEIMLRDGEEMYDATVILGPDFAERIQ